MKNLNSSKTGFTITGLMVTGPTLRPAEISLRSGINVIVGASDTGKTHILDCLDHVLGAGTQLKRFPENEHYTQIFASLLDRSGKEVTLCRAFDGGNLMLYESGLAEVASASPIEKLEAKHDANKDNNLSAFLLGLSGLKGKRVLQNELGKTRSLSFRDLAHVSIVSEETMWSDESPILSGQVIYKTVEASIFNLLVTGRDNAAIIKQENPRERNAQNKAKLNLIEDLISERKQQVCENGITIENIMSLTKQIETEIKNASETASFLQTELSGQEKLRKSNWEELQTVNSRLIVLNELLSRFDLLAKHYSSDISRLDAMIEAGNSFSSIEANSCPVCGAIPPGAGSSKSVDEVDIPSFVNACQHEITKIYLLVQDLNSTRKQLLDEQTILTERSNVLNNALKAINAKVQEYLDPKIRASQTKLLDLIKNRQDFAKAEAKLDEITALTHTRISLEAGLKAKQPKTKISSGIESRTTEGFCEEVHELLSMWKYPELGRVVFDNEKLDLVIGAHARGSQGKGYRAIAHAAFSIGLMRYCRKVGLPHSGVVMLDSPLVTLQEPDVLPEDIIPQSMKDAFYESLIENPYGDQIIILENDEPPKSVKDKINYIHFSKSKSIGRYGFYPV